jgi:hypothetical protein
VAAATAAKVYSWLHQEEKSRNALSSHPVIQRYVADACARPCLHSVIWQTGFHPSESSSLFTCVLLRVERSEKTTFLRLLLCGARQSWTENIYLIWTFSPSLDSCIRKLENCLDHDDQCKFKNLKTESFSISKPTSNFK